jgi:hypothetical protein
VASRHIGGSLPRDIESDVRFVVQHAPAQLLPAFSGGGGHAA